MMRRSTRWMLWGAVLGCVTVLGASAFAKDPYARYARSGQTHQQEQQRAGWYRANASGPAEFEEEAYEAPRRPAKRPAAGQASQGRRTSDYVRHSNNYPAAQTARVERVARPQTVMEQPYYESDEPEYENDARFERGEMDLWQPERASRTAYYDAEPMVESDGAYEEVMPGEWEGNGAPMQPGMQPGSGNYDVFDDAYSAIDGTHYRSSFSTRCDGGECNGCCENGCCENYCGWRTFGAMLHGLGEAGVWVQADYLLWWTKGASLPPLVTTSPDETPRQDAGVLGEPGTQIVFGNQRYLNEARSGGRIEFGAYLDACHTVGIGGGYFGLGEQSATYANASAGEPIIARPFFSTLTNAQDSALTAYSSTESGDVAAGALLARTSNDLQNANFFMTKQLYRHCGVRWDGLAGYRFTRFDEDLAIGEFITVTETGSVVPRDTTFDALDSFDVVNRFNGGDLGLQFESCAGRWALDGMLKIGLGAMYQEANIWGRTIVTPPGGAPDAREGDLLAMSSNIGSYSRSKFAYVPEARLNISFLITPTWRVTAGYTFIYWSEVIRVGQTIDTTVNPTLIFPPVQGPQRPTYSWTDSDLWAQGLNVGTELRY